MQNVYQQVAQLPVVHAPARMFVGHLTALPIIMIIGLGLPSRDNI